MTPQELKNSILLSAIQGKLVEQYPEEGTAEELFHSIAFIEKKDLKNISEEEIPFEIPASWKWVRHNTLFEIIGGSQPPKSSFLDAPKEGCVRLYQIRDYGETPVPVYVSKNLVTKFTQRGDILLARYGASVGKVFLAEDGAYNVAMAKVTPLFSGNPISKMYLYYYYLAPLYQFLVRNNSRSAQAGFNKDDLNSLLFPLPPLAEQNRIVAKLEEILPLIDRYEAAWNKLEEFNKRFPGDMQKSILQLAIQGKLVEQRPEEGTGEELFQQIQAEKQALIKAGKIKKEKPLPEIAEDEIPFDIPDTWKWVRFLSVIEIATNLVQPGEYQECMHIAPDNIEKATGKLLECHTVREDKVGSANHLFAKGQIIYSKIRPLLRKAVIAPFDGLCSADMYPLNTPLCKEYVLRYLLSDAFNLQVAEAMSSRVKMPKINQDELGKILIPLPPLAEQKRIVAKLEEILPLCERLK